MAPINPVDTPKFASLTSLVADWDVSARVTAFTTTRVGGVSAEPYDSLNLGFHVGDDKASVVENRRRLVDSFALPSEPVWLNQVHGTTVVQVDNVETFKNTEADAVWTSTPDTVIAVLTADCLPVVITDSTAQQIAVIHAGWRGLAGGILEKVLEVFPDSATLSAWLGPAIGPESFEVGNDVYAAFTGRNRNHEAAFVRCGKPGKYLADIYQLAANELQACRSLAICGGGYCTMKQANDFHSFRRDGKASGRMATVAWISPE